MKITLNFNNIMIILTVMGIFLMISQWSKSSAMCDGPKIVYKYIPRDFDLDDNYPEGISKIFQTMFRDPTPYIVNLGNDTKRLINV